MSRVTIIKEFWSFFRERKKYWLLPIVLMLLTLGIIIVVSANSAAAPFIYTIF